MMLGNVVIYVDDVKDCLDFYQRAFNLEIKLKYENEGTMLYGEVATDGATLGFASHDLGKMNLNGEYQSVSATKKPFGQEIVFISDDVAKTYERALSEGAISMAEPQQKPWGQTVAFIRAKEGTLIEICSPAIPEQ